MTVKSNWLHELAESRITIVGLGLMGGSLALSVRDHVASITAVDKDQEVLKRALNWGIVDKVSFDLESTLAMTDLLILATPVSSIITTLKWLASRDYGPLAILDLGSTKQQICELMSHLPDDNLAIGGHPLCGREVSGLESAKSTLYQNQPFVLCRTSRNNQELERLILQLINTLGAQPVFMSPTSHDEIVAATSHLPFITSAALIDVVDEIARSLPQTWNISATGLRDASRLAGSNPQVMLDILLSNKKYVVTHLETFGKRLNKFAALLEEEDDAALMDWLTAIQQQYWAYREIKYS